MKRGMAVERSTSAETSTLGFCWVDERAIVHIRESLQPFGNELLVWTLCDREVEDGTISIPRPRRKVTCSKCLAAQAILTRRSAKGPRLAVRPHDLPCGDGVQAAGRRR